MYLRILFCLTVLALVTIWTPLFSIGNHPQSPLYYHTETISDGQVRVVCDNGGDATIHPTEQFGSIIVNCGTR